MKFKKWMEVGQTGGVGGGLTPPKLNPLERGTNAFQRYSQDDDPPTGWSQTKNEQPDNSIALLTQAIYLLNKAHSMVILP